MKTDLDHPLSGRVPTIANPLRLSLTPVSYRKAPPILGADTHAVLEEILGWTKEQIAELSTEPDRPQELGDAS
jgi:crotonobetainyl-CoA:carnitine CoA-transferase CaiB-like acyl-CoA transferase